MLRSLSFRKAAINSLTIHDDHYQPDLNCIHIDDFMDLNVESLEEVILTGPSSDQAEQILDLALRSTCEEMTIELTMMLMDPALLTHDLIRRCVQLHISAGW
jgi:hypothetical protein